MVGGGADAAPHRGRSVRMREMSRIVRLALMRFSVNITYRIIKPYP